MTRHKALIGLLGLLGCGSADVDPSRSEDAPPASVELITVTEEDVPRHVTLVGSLRANREATIAAESAGRVVLAHGERGERIERGKLLARVDVDHASLAEANALAAAAREDREQSARDCDRADRLYAKAAISASEHEKMRSGCNAADHSVDAAEARARRAGKTLADALVRAPFSGTIEERYVEIGEHVAPGAPIIKLVDVSPLRLELTVPEQAVGSVALGEAIAFAVPALGAERFAAKVIHIAPTLRARSRDLVIEARVSSETETLRPGMFVTAYLETGRVKRPVVPASALVGTGPSRRVFVVRDGHFEERVVLVGALVGDLLPIELGLVAGEQIAASAAPDLKDGARLAQNDR